MIYNVGLDVYRRHQQYIRDDQRGNKKNPENTKIYSNESASSRRTIPGHKSSAFLWSKTWKEIRTMDDLGYTLRRYVHGQVRTFWRLINFIHPSNALELPTSRASIHPPSVCSLTEIQGSGYMNSEEVPTGTSGVNNGVFDGVAG